jgi:hypothetical protein
VIRAHHRIDNSLVRSAVICEPTIEVWTVIWYPAQPPELDLLIPRAVKMLIRCDGSPLAMLVNDTAINPEDSLEPIMIEIVQLNLELAAHPWSDVDIGLGRVI